MEVPREVVEAAQPLTERIIYNPRVERAEAEARFRLRRKQLLKQVGQRQARFQVSAVGGDFDAGQHDFVHACRAEPRRLAKHLVRRQRAHPSACIRNNAVGAEVVAAVLYFKEGTGTSLRNAGRKQLVATALGHRRRLPALAAALLDLGYDINTTDESQIQEAYELLADAKSKGVYQSFVMDEVFGKMEGGNAAIAMYYAGDYLTMLDNNPDLKFVVPKEGSNWFVDAMCVLKTAQHKEEAEAWINFIASTESSLANMDYIGYASPNLEALEGYPAYYEETYGEPLDEERYEIMAAPDDVLARCELYTNLPSDTLTLYNDLWTELGI